MQSIFLPPFDKCLSFGGEGLGLSIKYSIQRFYRGSYRTGWLAGFFSFVLLGPVAWGSGPRPCFEWSFEKTPVLLADARNSFRTRETSQPRAASKGSVDTPNKVIVLVSPVSSGRHGPRELGAAGVQVITVDPGDIPSIHRGALKSFENSPLHLQAPGNLLGWEASRILAKRIRDLIQEKKLDLMAVLPGSEWGTQSAHQIAEILHTDYPGMLYAGPYSPALHLKSKYLERLSQDFYTRSVESLDQGMRLAEEDQFFVHPEKAVMVVKPEDEAGGAGVRFVHSLEEYQNILRVNFSGSKPQKARLIVQEFLGNEEGAYDAFVMRDPKTGQRRSIAQEFLDYWKWKDDQGRPNQYRIIELVKNDSLKARLIEEAARNILDRFPSFQGFVHLEFIMKPNERGSLEARLTKSTDGGFRPPGADLPVIAQMATGTNHFRLAAELLLEPGKLQQMPDQVPLQKAAALLFLNNFKTGARIHSRFDEILERIRRQAKQEGVDIFINLPLVPGQEIVTTSDLFDKMGLIAIAHPQRQVVYEWMATLEMLPWFADDSGSLFPLDWVWKDQQKEDPLFRYKQNLSKERLNALIPGGSH